MDLTNLNVAELSVQEQQNVDGGGFGPFMFGIRIWNNIVYGLYDPTIDDPNYYLT